MARDDANSKNESTVLFTAKIAETVRETVCAENGADANILGNLLLTRIEATGAAVAVKKIPKLRIFNMAAFMKYGSQSQPKCTRTVMMDIDIHIHHGNYLKLRRSRWIMSDQDVPEHLLGRPMLESLGLDTAQVLAAANKYFGSVDSDTINKYLTDKGTGRVSCVIEGVYHTGEAYDGQDEDEGTPDWCDLGS